MNICGIDEAGRGPVIGPLVICGLCAEEDKIKGLKVRDSKELSRNRREILYQKIIENSNSYSLEILKPEVIDSMRRRYTLNEIEAIYIAKIIDSLGSNTYYVDAADVNEKRFEEEIRKYLKIDAVIISRHHADRDYPIVSAASIVAKVVRDREIDRLKEIYGDFGSGYPSDPRTIKFLKEYLIKNRRFPPIVRTTWETLKKINTSLEFFIDGEGNGKTG
ncbi:MAG: ribonuclease HII [Thermoplasmata archaeon]